MQHDFSLDNQPGAAFRGDLNDALQALVGQSSGDTAPAVTYPFMWWMDKSGTPALLKQRNADNTAWITTAAITVDGWSPYYQGQEIVDFISVSSAWLSKAIGEQFPLRDDLLSVAAPPTDNGAYRYIKLTAGEAGFGMYNDSILINETISGTAPEITATAEISLPESPLHGQTVNLINTEERFLRAGPSGRLQDSENKSHTHGGSADAAGNHDHGIRRRPDDGTGAGDVLTATGGWPDGETGISNTTASGSHTHPLSINASGANEARPRNIGATYYMRIL